MPFPLDLWLVHPSPEAGEAFRQRFDGLPGVRVVEGRFEDLEPHDCFVTAGNAFGIMTAGIDAAVVAFHGPALMARVQRRIASEYLGERPVGTCVIEPTGTPGYPFVAHAPTMRMPAPIDGTDAVYRAAWASLLAVYRNNVAARLSGTPRSERSPCRPWGRGLGPSASPRRPGRWPPPTATTSPLRTGSTGTRPWPGTRRSRSTPARGSRADGPAGDR